MAVTPKKVPANRPATGQTRSRSAAGESPIMAARYEGPLPPPAMLRAYEELAPGAANRILSMAEFEQQQFHRRENRVIDSLILGQVLSYCLFAALIIVSFVLIFNGAQPAGFGLLVGTGVLLVLARNVSPMRRAKR